MNPLFREETNPIYLGGFLNLVEMRKLMGLSTSDFSKIALIHKSQIRATKPTDSMKNKLLNLEMILVYLWDISGGDKDAINLWLNKPSGKFQGLTPLMYMMKGRKNVKEVMETLRLMAYPEGES